MSISPKDIKPSHSPTESENFKQQIKNEKSNPNETNSSAFSLISTHTEETGRIDLILVRKNIF